MRSRKMWLLAIASLVLFSSCEELEKVIPPTEEQETHIPAEEEEEQEAPATEVEPEVVVEELEPVEEEPAVADIKKYVIAKGGQHATISFQEATLDSLKFRVKFDSTAIYETVNPVNQGDINKLYGLSDCGGFHHTNSARFGWRWYNNQLEIWAYIYANGKRKSAFVGTVSMDEFYTYQIRFSDNKYTFLLNDKAIEMPRACNGTASGYKLFPYFGGDESAPHDISIWIEEL